MVKTILLHLDNDDFTDLTKIKGDLTWDKFFVQKQKEDWNALHVNLHAVRLIKGYKATEFERKLSSVIIDRFKGTCEECKKVHEELSKKVETSTKKNILDNIGEIFK
jgi:hypothetical protein